MARRTPSEYENFIASLAEKLNDVYQVGSVGSGPRNRLRGKSSVNHQIDVSFIDRSSSTPELVVIECKNLRTGKAVQLGDVKILKATIDDIAGHPGHPSVIRGILVSTTPKGRGQQR